MNTYLFLYYGGTEPSSPEEGEAMMDAWLAYFSKIGHHLADGGAPIGARSSVGGDTPGNVTGYSLIMAESLEEARALTEDHPHLASGGTIEILECVEMEMDDEDEDEDEDEEDEDEEIRESAV